MEQETPETDEPDRAARSREHTSLSHEALAVAIEALQEEVRQRERAEAALRESEARFRTLIDHAPEAIVVLDVDVGVFSDVNENACLLFGMAREELLRHGPLELSPPRQPDGASSIEKGQAKIEQALAGSVARFEWVHRNAAGEDVPCEVFLVRLPSADRRLVRGSVVDISERKRAERRERNRRMVLEQLAKGQALPELLTSIVALVEQESPDALASVLVLDDSRRHLLHGAAPRLPDFYNQAIHGTEIGATAGSCGAAAFTGQRVVVEDIETHPNWVEYRDLARRAGLRACWSEPVLSSTGQVLGTFAIYHTTPQAPTEDELEIIAVAAHLASIAIERHRAEDELRQNEERFRSVVQDQTELVCRYTPECQLLFVNDAYARCFGRDPDELLGQSFLQFIPEARWPLIREFIAAFAPDQPVRTTEHPVVDGQGRTRWYQWTDRAFFDEQGHVVELQGVGRDVTKRRQAEDALRRLQEEQQVILDNAPAMIFYRDTENRILRVNDAAARAIGLPKEEIEGRHTAEIYPNDADRFYQQDLEIIRTGLPQLGLVESYTLPNGEQGWVQADKVPLKDESGCVTGIIVWAVDVTERRLAEEERRKFELQIQHAQKLESLGVLAGGIAHDFNNLLTSIIGYSDLALRELPPSSPATHLIGEAMRGARRAADLAKQMLAYSGKGRFVVEPIDLSRLTEDMIRLLEVSISKKCVLKFSLERDLPAIEADAAQMRQVVMNLVINASEAIGDRNGVIEVTTGVMYCDHAYLSDAYLDDNLREGTYVHLEVSDTGVGMTAETRANIFDPFFTTKFTGRGLGLSAVLGIVRGHRGTIKVYSEPGKGSSFKVLIPASPLLARDDERREVQAGDWRGSGTVLIVDDEESVRELAGHMMEAMGFTVLMAGDGREAVDIVHREGDRIRLILLDLTMPHMDGEETFRAIRRIRGDIRTILTSGYNEQSATSRFAGKGLAAFIQKPYRFDQLLAVVRTALE